MDFFDDLLHGYFAILPESGELPDAHLDRPILPKSGELPDGHLHLDRPTSTQQLFQWIDGDGGMQKH